MFYLLNPIWLLAASGIIIPIAIHLWNVKQGKTLKIGSIQLLAPTEQARARSLRLTEWLLLLIRCLLIILLAVLLAGPFWQRTSTRKGWVLMEKQDANQAYRHYQPLIDSLINAGYTFHLFDKGFKESDLQTVVNDTAKRNNSQLVSYWQLIKELDKQLLPGFPVYLFTNNKLNRFTGNRNEVSVALTWKTFTQTDSVSRFISNAYLGADDSIRIAMGETSPTATVFHQQTIAINQPKQKDFVIDVVNGSLQVNYHHGLPFPVDTTEMRVTIFTNDNPDDSRYLRAAVQSIQQVTKRKIELKSVNTIAQLPAGQNWLFWLSEQNIPAQVRADHVLQYEKGEGVSTHSQIETNDGWDPGTELYKRVASKETNGAIIWSDGFGKALLTKEQDGARQVYHFYSRFNPSWNELAWSRAFPQLIYGLMYENQPGGLVGQYDQRIIDETQLQLKTSGRIPKAAVVKNSEAMELKKNLWVIIFIVFCIERFFSFKIKKEPVHA